MTDRRSTWRCSSEDTCWTVGVSEDAGLSSTVSSFDPTFVCQHLSFSVVHLTGVIFWDNGLRSLEGNFTNMKLHHLFSLSLLVGVNAPARTGILVAKCCGKLLSLRLRFICLFGVQSGSLTDLWRQRQYMCCIEDNVNARNVYHFYSTKALFYWLGRSFVLYIFSFLDFFSEFVHFFCIIIILMIICLAVLFRSGDAIAIGCLVV